MSSKKQKKVTLKVEHAITPGMPSLMRKNAHPKRLESPNSFIFLVFNRVNVIKSEAKAAAVKVQAVRAFAEHSSEVFNFDRDFKTSFERRLLFSR